MKKKSFWKRCNRGFIVSMVLLVGVLAYVTTTQILLANEKREIRAVAQQIQTIMADTLKTPLADGQAMVADKTKAAAFKDATKKSLSSLFVKDAAYLDDGAQQFLSDLQANADNEQDISILQEPDSSFSIKIDEDTASVSMSVEYQATGKWYDYDNSYEPVLKDRSGTLCTDWSASLVLENGEWKIYRISSVSSYTY